MIATLHAFVEAHQAVIGLVLLAFIFAGFVLEQFPAAVIAILGASAFLVLGILDQERLFSVFSNEAPITIGAMFILSGALLRTGTIEAVAGLLIERARRSPRTATAFIFLGAFAASAFMNNTPVVIVLIPIIARLAKATGYSEKKLLMPLSFVAILGGTTTLIGTSTNLLVDAVARQEGMPGFGIFEISPIGLVAALAGAAVLLTIGRFALPTGEAGALYGEDSEADFLTELRVLPDSDVIGRPLGTVALMKRPRVVPLAIKRGGRFMRSNITDHILEAGDRIVLRIDLPELLTLRQSKRFDLGIMAGSAPSSEERLIEATIAPSHPALGRRLIDIPFLSSLPVRILGLTRHRNKPGPDLPGVRLHAADRVLVSGSEQAIRQMYDNPNLLGVGATRAREFRRHRAPVAIGALAGVVLLSALNLVSIGVAAIVAIGVILLWRCIDAEEAWSAIDGNVLVLIFAMLAVGAGLEQAGSVALVVDALKPMLVGVPPWALIFAVYFIAVLLTEIITNNAVAILLTPLVISLAHQIGAEPRPLVIAVMFAASACFATPIGYQTNTLVYAAGNYRFVDFLKVGVPLNILVGLATCTAIVFLT